MEGESAASSAAILATATVQRIDVAPNLAVLRARAPGETWFVVIASGRPGPLVGLCRQKPFKGAGLFSAAGEGAAVSLSEKLRWRSRIEGAKIAAIGDRRVVVAGVAGAFAIEASPAAGSRLSLRAIDEGEDPAAGAAPEDVEALCARGEALVRSFGEGALSARRQDLARALAKAIARVDRRMAAIAGDLGRIAEADGIAAQATAFVAEASRAPRGARSLTVTDWSTGEARLLELQLDPARPAREQIEAMFKRAKRLKLGAAIARRRMSEAEAAWEKLAAIAEQAKEPLGFEAIEALAREARIAAPRDFSLGAGGGAGKASARKPVAVSRPYRVFLGAGGARILIGKGAAGNDALTLHVARPHDLWLHAKGRTGAHAIVPLDKSQACPSDLLVDAAHLAAHFSDGREEAVIEIQHTPRRYLRKPKGAAPGLVIVDREKVLVLRVERDRLARLLAAEEIG
jgi:predicted ribosome quality control (RQC) complex YloA/Tae2 family protein